MGFFDRLKSHGKKKNQGDEDIASLGLATYETAPHEAISRGSRWRESDRDYRVLCGIFSHLRQLSRIP